MTREEAIKLLKEYAPRIKPFYEPYRTEYPQAIDMAIEALSAEPSGDLISRADAIRVISEEYHNRGGNFDGLDAVRELETLPSKGGDAEIEMLNKDYRPKYMQQCPDNGADRSRQADMCLMMILWKAR